MGAGGDVHWLQGGVGYVPLHYELDLTLGILSNLGVNCDGFFFTNISAGVSLGSLRDSDDQTGDKADHLEICENLLGNARCASSALLL